MTTHFSVDPPCVRSGEEGPDVGAESDLDRCRAVNHGCRCILELDHAGQHCATWGVYMRWTGDAAPSEQFAEHNAAALFWAAWAKRIDVDPALLLESFRTLALDTDFPPTWLLLLVMQTALPDRKVARAVERLAALPDRV